MVQQISFDLSSGKLNVFKLHIYKIFKGIIL